MRSGDLAWVYGAALRASASEESAAEAVRGALADPASEEQSRQALMARAVTGALARAPKEPFDVLPPAEREAIALARIVGMNVDEIAAFTASEASEVKSRMRSGLERLMGRLRAAELC